ncbi:protein angel homolog 2 isoform X2 [Anabrus simplex]|uniref:protein angel homolog 2 isoform X2 n=1 Tax=Anabrus simplex TaxID=316456 RepID=UPI0034DD549A
MAGGVRMLLWCEIHSWNINKGTKQIGRELDEGGVYKTVSSTKLKQRNLLKRSWQYTTMGAAMSSEEPVRTTPRHLVFDVLSYNVLSQSIMEDHPELYMAHDPRALNWDYRSQLLMKEFKKFNADIMCLQEVQKSHLESFYSKLADLGYTGIYKQRTGNKVDGVAIYYKNNVFDMLDYTTVEFYQPGIELLNRDNVGLVAKLAPKIKPQERIVVATTHLLFNPRRHDIKLAQTQILLAEVERFAFKGFDSSTGVAQYWPVILTGDLNLEPHSGVYQLLTTGSFQYEGLNQKTLSPGYGRNMSKHLLPRDLQITDTCQHWNVLKQRRVKMLDHKTERSLLKIYNSDYESNNNPTCEASVEESWVNTLCTPEETDNSNAAVSSKEATLYNMSENGFSTGRLSHNLNLKSVYVHDPERWYDNSQVTTYQGRWVVVDYIFYSSLWEQYLQQKAKDNLKLLARYRFLSEEEAEAIGPIPNLRSPSDHYPLCAKFALLLI